MARLEPMAGTQRFVSSAEVFLGWFSALLLFIMMLLTAVDVIGRYFLSAPLGGAYETTQLIMAAIVFVTLPSVTRRKEHVTVDLAEGLFVGRAAPLRDLGLALVVVLATAFLGWRLWLLAGRFAGYGDVTASWGIPLAPVAALGAIGLALSAAAALLLAIDAVRRLQDRPPA